MSRIEDITIEQVLDKDIDGCTCTIMKIGPITLMLDIGTDEIASMDKVDKIRQHLN